MWENVTACVWVCTGSTLVTGSLGPAPDGGSATLSGVEVLRTEQVYANPWMTVREDTVRRSDGSTGIYGVVDTPDIALIVPADGSRLHLVEQHRHPVGGRRWEFPSGSADARRDADAAALAARELREETGLVANRLTRLGTLEVSPSMFSQRCSVFVATELTAGPAHLDPEEQDLRSAWFTRTDVERMISDGTITDGKTVAAYALLLVHGR